MQEDDVRTLFSRLGANKVHLQSKYVFRTAAGVPATSEGIVEDPPKEEEEEKEKLANEDKDPQNTFYECCTERLGAPEDLKSRVIGACLNDSVWRRALRRKRQDQEMLELLNRADHDPLFARFPKTLEKVAQICGINMVVFDGFDKCVHEVHRSGAGWALLRASSDGRFEHVVNRDDLASANRALCDLVLATYQDFLRDLSKKRAVDITRLCGLLDVPFAHKSKAEQIEGIERRVRDGVQHVWQGDGGSG